ncbi:MAG: DUF1963 domain-containing protein [Polyangiales bacterium]
MPTQPDEIELLSCCLVTWRFDPNSDFPERGPDDEDGSAEDFWLEATPRELDAWTAASPLRGRWPDADGVIAVRPPARPGWPQTLLMVERREFRCVIEHQLPFVKEAHSVDDARRVEVTLTDEAARDVGLEHPEVVLRLPGDRPWAVFNHFLLADTAAERRDALLQLLGDCGVAALAADRQRLAARDAQESAEVASVRREYHALYERVGRELGALGVQGELRARLEQDLRGVGLTDRAVHFCDWARPALRFVSGPSRGLSLGASRIGGAPDLPVGMSWPDLGGGLLTFVAQVRLEELPPLPGVPLPRHGLLSLFVENEGDFEPSGCVLWSGSSELARATPPSGVPFVDEGLRALPERGLRFELVATLPAYGSVAYQALGIDCLSHSEQDSYFGLLDLPEGTKRLGGHPACLGHDAAEDLVRDALPLDFEASPFHQPRARVARRAESGDAGAKRDLETFDHWAARRAELVRELHDWVCLFSMDSDYASGEVWGSGGELQYWIRRSELVERRFDGVTVVEISS